jgi:hypothetical protein
LLATKFLKSAAKPIFTPFFCLPQSFSNQQQKKKKTIFTFFCLPPGSSKAQTHTLSIPLVGY